MDGAHQSARSNSDTRLGRFIDAVDQFTPVLTVVALLMVMTAAVYTFQGQARISGVIDCLGGYTQDYDAAQDPRVKAQGELDAAEVLNDSDAVAWAKAVNDLIHGVDPDAVEFSKVNTALLDSLRKVRKARIHVQDTRRANPYPAPCKVE